MDKLVGLTAVREAIQEVVGALYDVKAANQEIARLSGRLGLIAEKLNTLAQEIAK